MISIRFLVVLLAVTLGLVALNGVFFQGKAALFYYTLALFFVGAVATHCYTACALGKRAGRQAILIAPARLLLYGAYAFGIMWLEEPQRASADIIAFVVVYLLFSVLEVLFYYKRLSARRGV